MIGNGENCTQTDPCESNPCYPGVHCTSLHEQGLYKCESCPEGFIGDGHQCRLPYHPCESNPCFPGVECGIDGDNYSCGACPRGMEGDGITCRDIDDCSPTSCYPGVSCEDKRAPSRGFVCGPCPPGYDGNGISCSKQVWDKVPCPDDKHCFHGVDCYKSYNSTIQCGDCPEGYYGDGVMCKPKCHRLKCKPDTEYCSAPETCSRKFVIKIFNAIHTLTYICSKAACIPGCKNGGRCVRPGRCKCRSGFRGKRCQSLSRKTSLSCREKGCKNGGTCMNSGKCLCPVGSFGKFCHKKEERMDEMTFKK